MSTAVEAASWKGFNGPTGWALQSWREVHPHPHLSPSQPADPAASDRLLWSLKVLLALADTTDTSVVNVNQCFLASAGMLLTDG